MVATTTTPPVTAAPAVLPAVATGDINALATQIGIVSVTDLTREERIALLECFLATQQVAAITSFASAVSALATAGAALTTAINVDMASSAAQTTAMIAASTAQTVAIEDCAKAAQALAPKT